MFGWLGAFLVTVSLVTLLSVDATIISKSDYGVERQRFVSILGIGFVIVLGALVTKSHIVWKSKLLTDFFILISDVEEAFRN